MLKNYPEFLRQLVVPCLVVVFSFMGSKVSAQSNLVISGIVDGPLSGGVPKAIELYALNDIPDLSIYGVEGANNGAAASGPETMLSGSATAGDYLYVASETDGFSTFFGFNPDFTGVAASINGDDAIVLYQNGSIIDVFGAVGTDGTGEAWEYKDGWAYRVQNTGPDGSSFELGNWTFSGTNALDGENNNASASTPFPLGSYEESSTPESPLLVAGEDFDGNSLNLISGFSPATDNRDGGPGDFFGVGSRNNWPQSAGVPFNIADDSAFPYNGGSVFESDDEGVFGQNADLDNNYFGIVDSDEFGNDQTASWSFDVAGKDNLELRIDMGGVSNSSFGGFSTSTELTFTAQIDGGATQTIFSLSAVDAINGFTTRPMDSGNPSGGGRVLEVTGDNGVIKLLAEDGTEANNTYLDKSPPSGPGAGKLDTFIGAIAGSGSTLTITVSADFPFEGMAFDNIQVFSTQGEEPTPDPVFVINEFDADQESTDAAEFIEIYDGGVGNSSLNGLTIVLYNGSDDASYDAINLDGFSTNADGFFVVGSENVPNVNLTEFTTNGIQNGADAIALYRADASEFPRDTPIEISDRLIDAVVYGTNDSDDSALLALLTDGQPQLNDNTEASLQRIPNGEGGARNTENFQLLAPSPGLINEIPPFVEVAIYDIQGETHTSPFLGEEVRTTGLVTATDNNGFYVQDAAGDNNPATSDALFVFTGGTPDVRAGDEVQITGPVSEFFPGGQGTGNLSSTQMSNAQIEVLSSGNVLPAPVVIGQDGRVPPAENIDDDAFGAFEPETDGLDFFESLEAMRVTVQQAVAVAGLNRFGEIFTVANNGSEASGLSERGTLNISPDDFNPEKIQIDEDRGILPGFDIPVVNTGDQLGDITGVVGYGFGNFEVYPTEPFNIEATGNLTGVTSSLKPANDQITVASYNVLNLDPNDNDGDTDLADGRFTAIATQIVNNLNAPDIIGLQEVQDNSGSDNDGTTSASLTLQTLADAVSAAGGPDYRFIDNTFITDGASGGQPGGNIRTAFFYNPDRVSLVDGSVQPIGGQAPGEAFNGARLPLAATFTFNAESFTLVSNHFSSKGGSSPIFGVEQPFESRQEDVTVNGSLDERQEQSQAVQDFVISQEEAHVIVLGDFNEFEFVSPVQELETNAGLVNLTNTLPENERYSFIFQGNSQSLDHILVSSGVQHLGVQFEAVHTNSEFAETSGRASDHDPLLASVTVPVPLAVIGFSLVNIFTGHPVAGFDPIVEGAEIPLPVFFRSRYTLVANTNAEDVSVGSVALQLSGGQAVSRVENVAPYALFSNTPSGKFLPWRPGVPRVGRGYRLQATPYTEPDAMGEAGISSEVSFTFTGRKRRYFFSFFRARELPQTALSDQVSEEGTRLFLYPNPVGDVVNIYSETAYSAGELSFTLVDMMGKQLDISPFVQQQSDHEFMLDTDALALKKQVYLIRITRPEGGSETIRFVRQ